MSLGSLAILTLIIIRSQSPIAFEPEASQPQKPDAIKKMRHEAAALRVMIKSRLGREFLDAVDSLHKPNPRTIYRDDATRKTYSAIQASQMPEEERGKLRRIDVDDHLYYFTRYGSPLAYARAIDILGQAGVKKFAGKKIVDFGYGGIGHLRMLASLGADTIGLDVDPFLTAVYSNPEDQGMIPAGKHAGRIRLLQGHWPADEGVEAMADGNWDVFISKNTLKNGYLHPARPVDKRMLVDLRVSDSEFVSAVFSRLKPGGFMLIYNICPAPAPADKPYIPWADGTSPFSRSMLESAGFEVRAFDQQDDSAVRQMAGLLGWDEGDDGMDLEKDLFAWYTLVRKPVEE